MTLPAVDVNDMQQQQQQEASVVTDSGGGLNQNNHMPAAVRKNPPVRRHNTMDSANYHGGNKTVLGMHMDKRGDMNKTVHKRFDIDMKNKGMSILDMFMKRDINQTMARNNSNNDNNMKYKNNDVHGVGEFPIYIYIYSPGCQR